MSVSKIANTREFFDHVVTPDFNDLNADRTDLRLAFHACTSLLSLRDWVHHAYKNTAWKVRNTPQKPFASKSALQSALGKLCSDVDIVADIANASKHRVLRQSQSYTSLYGSANVVIQVSHGGALGSGPIGAAPLGGGSSLIVVQIGNKHHDVFGCINDVNSMWSALILENQW
jgi:hypothetical protein